MCVVDLKTQFGTTPSGLAIENDVVVSECEGES